MLLDGSRLRVWCLAEAQRKLGISAGGVPPTRQINTTGPLTGGGNLSADRTISMPKATALIDGYLSAADFAAFLAGTGQLLVNIVAAENIPAFNPVTSLGLKADTANPSASMGRVIGLATAAIALGFSGTIIEGGEITNGAWTWATGDPIFLSGTTLANTPPVSGFSQQIGTAKSATAIVVDLSSPLLL